MKIISSLLFLSGFSYSVIAQPEKLGIIEVYGAKTVSVAEIRKAIGLNEGDLLDRKTFDKAAIEKRVLSVPGLAQANVSLICCDEQEGRTILYAGVSEEKSSAFPYRDKPTGNYQLSKAIVQTYRRYENIWKEAVKAGQTEEDDEQGHVLLTYAPARPLQDSFVYYATTHLPLLEQVIRQSASAEQRQIAAWIIAYATDKKAVVNDLLFAAEDADETVRNNATRALGLIIRYGSVHSSSGIVVPWQPFIKMIRSTAWTDRNKGAMLLQELLNGGDSSLVVPYRQEALPQLEEMARWRNPGHALFSMFILGRIAKASDEEVFFASMDKDKQAIITKWMEKIRRER